ncbi:hypothetical protein QYM36_009968 [Artemia franciscana]|uniref:DUF4371 domain-containing protein n=1 Tax=Artemia franciscana TaxID=6661 RepID=A0AA88HQA0_ARTSF|nr:hypothetical protein QYM36_009968 [Artemia franciscana]
MVGQGYDGVAVMRGHLRGAQDVIQQQYPKEFYVHCGAHSLNLVLYQSILCSLEALENLLLYSRKQNLTGLCEPRWVKCQNSVMHFLELYQPILCSLEALEELLLDSRKQNLTGLCEPRWVKDIDVCHEKVIDIFVGKKNRRLEFIL